MFSGEIYPDGSALDGPSPELMRCGSAFVVRWSATGKIIASAMRAPPPWITDIGGAEALGHATGSTQSQAGRKVHI